MKIDKNYSLKLSLFSFGIGVLVFAIRLYGLIPVVNLVFFGEETVGEVTDLKVYKNDDEYTYKPTVKYNCGGSSVEYSTESYSSSYNYGIGRKLTLYCDPLNPKTFYIKGSERPNLIIIGLTALLYLGWGLYKLGKDLINLLYKYKLKRIGVVVKAKVDSVKLHYKNSIGNILAEGGDDALDGGRVNQSVTIKKRLNLCYIIAKEGSDIFESGLLSPYVKYIIKPGDDIDVYVNPKNRKQYWVDIGSICDRKIQGDYIRQELGIKSTSSLNISNFGGSTISSAVLVQHTYKGKKLSRGLTSDGVMLIILIIIGLILFFLLVVSINDLVYSNVGSKNIVSIVTVLLFLCLLYHPIIGAIKSLSLKKLMGDGILVDGIVIDVIPSTFMLRSRKVIALHGDKIYESPLISFYKKMYDIDHYVNIGDHVAIYVDSQDESRYWMDVKTLKGEKDVML